MSYTKVQRVQPLRLHSGARISEEEMHVLNDLYLTAESHEWVSGLSTVYHPSTDLESARWISTTGQWSRGLLVQAVVMELLGLAAQDKGQSVVALASNLRTSFQRLVATRMVWTVPSTPSGTAGLYFKLWEELSSRPVCDADPHPGLDRTVPRRLRKATEYHAPQAAYMPAPCPRAHNLLETDYELVYRSFQNDYGPLTYPSMSEPLPVEALPDAGSSCVDEEDIFMPIESKPEQCGVPGDKPLPWESYLDARFVITREAKRKPECYIATPLTESDGIASADTKEELLEESEAWELDRDGVELEALAPAAQPIRPSREQMPALDFVETMRSTFDLPITAAARRLGVSLTVLKMRVRKHGIKRWPYRKLSSLDKLIESVQSVLDTDQDTDNVKVVLAHLRKERDAIYQDPNMPIGNYAKKLRQSLFKQQFQQRRSSASHQMAYESSGRAAEGMV